MTIIRNHSVTNRLILRATLLTAAATLLLASASPVSAALTAYTWTGASATSSNWSDTANWSGGIVPSTTATSGQVLIFAAQTKYGIMYSSNNLVNVRGIDGIVFYTTNAAIAGLPITIDASPTGAGQINNYCAISNFVAAQSNYWSIPITNNNTDIMISGNGTGSDQTYGTSTSVLTLAGYITGLGAIFTPGSSAGIQQINLLCTTNDFTGTGGHCYSSPWNQSHGPLCTCDGTLCFNSMGLAGAPSSFGACSATVMDRFGGSSTGTGYAESLCYVGTTDATSGALWAWNLYEASVSGRYYTLSNNSPNNNNLTWAGPIVVGEYPGSKAGTAGNPIVTWMLGGSSTGTNTIVQSIASSTAVAGATWNNSIYAGLWPTNEIGLTVKGPGTWVFQGLTNCLNGPWNLTSNAKLIIQSNQVIIPYSLTDASGATLDVSWNDTNSPSVGPYTIGTNAPYTLNAGSTGTSSNADIIGSLALATPNPSSSPTNGGTLNVAGGSSTSLVIGTLTITNSAFEYAHSPRIYPTFVPGGGTLNFVLGTNNGASTTAGSGPPGNGSNALINVCGNVDLSQGTATAYTWAWKSKVATGVPYTLIAYSGTFTPHAPGSTGMNVVGPSGFVAGSLITNNPNVIQVQFFPSGSPSNLVWTGSQSANWNLFDQNWVYALNPSQSTVFQSADPVLFPDTGVSQFSVNVAGPMTPASFVVSNSAGNPYVFSSSTGQTIGATGTLTKQGAGSLTLNTANTFGSGIVISAGTLVAGNPSAFGASSVTLGDSYTYNNSPSVSVLSAGVTLSIPVTVTTNCTGSVTIGNAPGYSGHVSTINFFTNITINSANAGLATGSVFGSNGNVTVTGGNIVEMTGAISLTNGYIAVNGGTSLKVDNAPSPLPNLDLDQTSSLSVAGYAGLNVTFAALTGSNGSPTIVLNFGGTPPNFRAISVGPTNANQTAVFKGYLSGAPTAGVVAALSFFKTGLGTEVFTGDSSSMFGTNTIQAGTMQLDNTTGSGLPAGPVTVNSGTTLCGLGSIMTTNIGGVTVNGSLVVGDPGNNTGANASTGGGETFTVATTNSTGGYMQITSGGSLTVNLYSGAGNGDNTGNAQAAGELNAQIPVSLSSGAVLNIGNPNGMTQWAAGDKWTIANWQSAPTNTFTVTNPPALPAGLSWSLSGLYNAGAGVIEVMGTPVITWASPSPISYGTALGSGQLNATANVPGTFTYTPPTGTSLGLGDSQTLSVTFTPADTNAYATVTTTTTINVQQATPVITWANPAPITDGTALSSIQLNATANVPGTFAYNPSAGVVLAVGGNRSLSVTFTPNDTTDYTTATKTVGIDVLPTPPVISSIQPPSQTNNATTTAAFTVIVSGGTAPFSYQWTKMTATETNLLSDAGNIFGATSNVLTISNVLAADQAEYAVTVTNAAGSATTNGTLVVIDPFISGQPASVTNSLFSTVVFSVVAVGTTPLSYQWQQDDFELPGETNSSLTLSEILDSDAGDYSVVVSNSVGQMASATATLTITHPPVIVSHPASLTLNQGATAIFNVGINGASPFTYQWTKNGASIPGATSRQLILSSVTPADAATYELAITNADGGVLSGPATLTVVVPPAITSQPVGLTNDAGATAIFSVTVSGTPPAYQWFKMTGTATNALSDGGSISGSLSNVLTLSNNLGADDGYYMLVASNQAGVASSSNAVLLVIDPIITNEPASLTVNVGNPASFSVGAYGTAPHYQWYSNGVAISGATTSTYAIGSAGPSDATGYTVVVSNQYGMVTSTPSATLTVIVPPVITGQPQSRTNNAGTTATFSVTATGSAATFQWYQGVLPITGATAASLVLTNVQDADAGSYSVVLSNASATATSDPASLTVIDGPVITGQPQNQTNNASTTATFAVTNTGTAPFSYQWYKMTVTATNALTNGGNISGSTSNVLTVASVLAADEGSYAVTISNPAGTVESSNALLVVQDPAILVQPVGVTNMEGGTVTFSVSAAGTPALSYQWYQDGAPLYGDTNGSLALTNITDSDAGSYTVVVSNSISSVTSAPALLVTVAPLITSQPVSLTVPQGQSAVFSVDVNGATPFSYQWLLNGTNMANATNRFIFLSNVSTNNGGSYQVVVVNPSGTQTSKVATLTVAVPPAITVQPVNVTAVAGQTVNFGVAATGGVLCYQWHLSDTNLPSATNSTLTLNSVTTNSAGTYSVTVTNIAGTAISSNVTLSVYSSAVPILTVVSYTNQHFTVTLTGVPTLSYSIQASPNMVAWVPLVTNASPFTFTDTNVSSYKFYRGSYR